MKFSPQCMVKFRSSTIQLLLALFTALEINETIKSMHPNKSPGPDGFNLCFYQTYWDDVGPAVTAACLQCLNNCSIPEGMNDTNIILIPKVKKPTKLTELRPILLCNVIIKIMTKAMANWFKLVLNSIILET